MMTKSNITYSQTAKNVRDFIENVRYSPDDMTVSHVSEYLMPDDGPKGSRPEPFPVGIEPGDITICDGASHLTYTVTSAERATFAPSLTPNVDSSYTVTRDGDVTETGTIRPTHRLRQVDGGDGFENARDIGGWKCDGGTVRYGRIFRGSEIGNAKTARRILVERLGVGAELELRGISERRATVSPLGDDIKYYIPTEHQYYTVSKPQIWKGILRFIFDCVRDDVPLYMHCAAGADRTGTCAAMIEAILGVSRSDIDLEFELTNFSLTEGWRQRNDNTWRGLMFELNEELPARESLRDRVISYVGALGFTSDEINAFRHAMIDGTPEDIDLEKINGVSVTTFPQVDPTVEEYLENTHYTARDAKASDVLEYAARDTGRDKSKPLSYFIDTDGGELHVHDRGTHKHYVTDGTVPSLTPGVDSTYAVVKKGRTEKFGVIRPTGTLRAVDGGRAVSNLRDLGGWKCDGGTVRYSRIFRGGQIEDVAEARKILSDRLGISAELDLKGNMYSWADHSALGEDIDYCRPKNCQWYTLGDRDTWREMLSFVFTSIKDNKPTYIHCAGGADRTGTLVCILLALLGVSEEDIEKEFELTNFADTGRTPLRNGKDWRRLRLEIESVIGGDNFSEHVISYVSSLGFSEDDINSFRRHMVDGSPENVDLERINGTKIIEFNQMNPAVEAYLSDVHYDCSTRDVTYIQDYINRETDYDKTLPLGAVIHTDGGTLRVFDRYTHIAYEEEVAAGDVCIKNVCPRIGADYSITRDGEIEQKGFIRPTGALRMIDCGKAAVNIRDLGGRYCKGGRVAYGKMYRGGTFFEPEEARRILVDRLGIGADINLRGAEESPETVSPLGEDILFCRPNECQWYTIASTDTWRETLGFVFDCAERDVPVYFHCYSGADRTGTLSAVIEALLGVSDEDMDKNYELTNFENNNPPTRLRTMVGEYQWGNLMHEFSLLPGDGPLSERIEKWMTDELGFERERVERFKATMTDSLIP